MIYFISGHRDLSKEDFKKYYIPIIEEIIRKEQNTTFVIGDCNGVDSFAMDYLYCTHADDCCIIIFHMLESPRNTPMGLKVEDFINMRNGNRVFFRGGFESDEERDSAMTRISDFDIAFVKDNRWDSGTAQNIKRRHGIQCRV